MADAIRWLNFCFLAELGEFPNQQMLSRGFAWCKLVPTQKRHFKFPLLTSVRGAAGWDEISFLE